MTELKQSILGGIKENFLLSLFIYKKCIITLLYIEKLYLYIK
jgi:hypothetical protein